jgi:hypothetical protein
MGEIIWKYYSLPTFIALLQGQTLHFTNVRLLEDKMEFKANINEPKFQSYSIAKDETNERLYVNCWSENEDSYALWKIYLKGKYGLAIQSTKKKLSDIVHRADPIRNFLENGIIKEREVDYNNKER